MTLEILLRKLFLDHLPNISFMRFFIFLFFISNISFSQDEFTLDQIKSYPFPNELTGSTETSKIAWAFDEEGKRNIYVAEGPSYISRRLTSYMEDTHHFMMFDNQMKVNKATADFLIRLSEGDIN